MAKTDKRLSSTLLPWHYMRMNLVNSGRPAFKLILAAIVFVVLCAAAANAQQPFVTDDADVMDTGRYHLEISNELDRLQPASLPVREQNGLRFGFAYGLARDVEVNVSVSVLTLAASGHPRYVGGFGDTTLGVKYKFHQRHENSRVPDLAIVGFVQFPTGNAARGLGSGVADYGFYGVAQRLFGRKTTGRLNAGVLFAGNTLNGALGISSVKGKVFTGSASMVRKINDKLQLGGEISGAVTANFLLSKGQLQTQLGGNYQATKRVSLDFGLIAGRFAASPRLGFLIGTSIDF
jgi:hypothetical protein